MKEILSNLIHVISSLPMAIVFSILVLRFFDFAFNLGPGPLIAYPFLFFIMIGYYYVPSVGIIYSIIWYLSLAECWKIKEKPKNFTALLIVYSITLAVLVGYIIWWYATKQVFNYL